ncbi:MAG: hypothetical protein V3R56_01300 [Xanthomonadales bacterium]
MEFALRIATLDSAFKTPCELCNTELCKTGLGELCPDAQLTALYFGTEFCQELIPGIKDAAAFCAHCAECGLEAVLLTPLVTHKGLTRLDRLFGDLTRRGMFPAIVFNDWGVLELLRKKHPSFPLRMGRLMNRGLRDPRLDMQDSGPEGENIQRGAGIRKLASSLGVSAVESDADLEPGFLGGGADGLQRALHIPFTFAASGRNCLEKAAATLAARGKITRGIFTQGLKSGCTAPCRGISRKENRQDTQKEMWRAGNTLFFKAPLEWISRHLALADRVVFHEQPIP